MYIVEEFCPEILILDKGHCVLQGNLAEIKGGYKKKHAIIKTNIDISALIPKNITTVGASLASARFRNRAYTRHAPTIQSSIFR